MFKRRSISRALVAVTAAGTGLVAAPSLASADHVTPPGTDQGLIIGGCYKAPVAGGLVGFPCIPGWRPWLAATEYSGADRTETARLAADAYLRGDFQPGTVFVARWEDFFGAAFMAHLVAGTAVLVNGGDGPLDEASRARALAAHEHVTKLVFFGGDQAINVGQRVEIAQAVWWGS